MSWVLHWLASRHLQRLVTTEGIDSTHDATIRSDVVTCRIWASTTDTFGTAVRLWKLLTCTSDDGAAVGGIYDRFPQPSSGNRVRVYRNE